MVREPEGGGEPPSGGRAAERRRQLLRARFPNGVLPTELEESGATEDASTGSAGVSSEDEPGSGEDEGGARG
jgi:hypothetical protein